MTKAARGTRTDVMYARFVYDWQTQLIAIEEPSSESEHTYFRALEETTLTPMAVAGIFEQIQMMFTLAEKITKAKSDSGKARITLGTGGYTVLNIDFGERQDFCSA